MPPRVSIITPTYNQAQFIRATLDSVRDQDYPHIEHLVIDGGSTDGTQAILAAYDGAIRWISEPDRGQGDAINKGFRMASGDIFAWLNSDDLYVTPHAVRTIVEFFEQNPQIAFVYGDCLALNEHDENYGIRTHVKQVNAHDLIHGVDSIVQPAAFWRASLWQACGELDISLRYTLDYEYWMRAALRYEFRYVPVLLAKERLYANAKTFSGDLERIHELESIALRHGGSGIPRGYAPIASATYARHALKALFRGKLGTARQHAKSAFALRPPPIRFLQFFVVMTVFGSDAIPKVWLWLNRRRQGRKSHVRTQS
jgi:glycosyltransferase involved in cell wall biosynthesis